jgi:hypothetical protein
MSANIVANDTPANPVPNDPRPVLSDGLDLAAAISAALSKHGSGADPNIIAATVANALSDKNTRPCDLPAVTPLAVVEHPSVKRFSQAITDSTSELPPHIIKALEGGFKTYIPLASCTHAACRTASRTVESYENEISLTEKGEVKVKHKSMNPARDHLLTTDEFSQVRENFVRGVKKHLILSDASVKDATSAHECADMFAHFFLAIVERPDWTEDWPDYRGYLIDSYIAWVARRDDTYGMIFDEHAFNKFKIKNLNPNIAEIVRQQIAGSSSNVPSRGSNNNNRGRGNQRGKGRGGGSLSQSFREPSYEPKCYLCGGNHLHKDHQGKAKRLVEENGKWVDKALGNRVVCILYNVSPHGCRRATAGTCYFSHTCSLCGDPSHGCSRCDA